MSTTFYDVGNQLMARISIFCAFRDEQFYDGNVRHVGEQFTMHASSKS